MNTRVTRLLGDAYDDYMRGLSPTPTQVGGIGFWSTVGTLLSNRGVVQVQKPKSNSAVSYIVLGAAALGMAYVATKA